MDITQALKELGAWPDLLNDSDRRQLDDDGFLHIPNALSTVQLDAVRARQAELLKAEGSDSGKEVHQEAGTDRLADLVNKGDCFTIFYTHPTVLAAIAHVLKGDLKLSSLNGRNALPGKGLQPLHADWGRLETAGDYQVCNSIWLLDDFTTENGATRAVAGSHRSAKTPGDEMPDPSKPHPREQLLLGKAGDCFVFNSHTWHGGTSNRTDRPRRALHAYFCRRHQSQQLNQREFIRKAVWDRLSPAARTVLDVE